MFADRIKELRLQHKLTQREFAERAGISTTTLISYEKGGKTPSYDILVRLANTFSVSLDWLCEVEQAIDSNRSMGFCDVLRTLAKLAKASDWGNPINIDYEKEYCGVFGGYGTYKTVITIKLNSELNNNGEFLGDIVGEEFYSMHDINEKSYASFTNHFCKIFEELDNMVRLVHDGIIQEDLFNLWLERKCEECSDKDILYRNIKAGSNDGDD